MHIKNSAASLTIHLLNVMQVFELSIILKKQASRKSSINEVQAASFSSTSDAVLKNKAMPGGSKNDDLAVSSGKEREDM